jgi:hypothetical protein
VDDESEAGVPAQADTLVSVFVSYRRDDVPDATDRLAKSLIDVLGDERVFLDVDTIEIGAPFADVIEKWVGRCDVLLAVIGHGWLTATDDAGERRLENPKDYVRLEIEAGLSRDIRVVPVLVHDVPMPRASELPETLVPMLDRNAVKLSRTHWDFDVARLVSALQRIGVEKARKATEAAHRQAQERSRREAEARAPREAEEQQRRETEARAQREAEEQREAPVEGSPEEVTEAVVAEPSPTELPASTGHPASVPSAGRRPSRRTVIAGAGAVAAVAATVAAVLAIANLPSSGGRQAQNAATAPSLRQPVGTLDGIVQLFIAGKRLSQVEHNYTAAAHNRTVVLQRLDAFNAPPPLRAATHTLRAMTADSLLFNQLMAAGETARARAPDNAHNALRLRFVDEFNPYAGRYLGHTYAVSDL